MGCYGGDLNGVWTPATRKAMKAFTDRVNATLPVDQADDILLTLVQAHQGEACGALVRPAKGSPTTDAACPAPCWRKRPRKRVRAHGGSRGTTARRPTGRQAHTGDRSLVDDDVVRTAAAAAHRSARHRRTHGAGGSEERCGAARHWRAATRPPLVTPRSAPPSPPAGAAERARQARAHDRAASLRGAQPMAAATASPSWCCSAATRCSDGRSLHPRGVRPPVPWPSRCCTHWARMSLSSRKVRSRSARLSCRSSMAASMRASSIRVWATCAGSAS